MIDPASLQLVEREADLRLKDSPVFRKIIAQAVVEPELWSVLARAADITQGVQLFPAAIHAVLMKSSGERFTRYFPTLGGNTPPVDGAFARELLHFVRTHLNEIVTLIMARRHIVKSDVRRAAVLRCAVAQGWRSLGNPDHYALIDFGCGMGTALLLDRSGTSLEDDHLRLEIDAQHSITIPLRGSGRPSPDLPPAVRRTGLDVTRLDPRTETDRNFVLGHVFPEQTEAFAALAAATGRLAMDPPAYRIGDTLAELEREFDEIAPELPVILMHSMMIHCLSEEARGALDHLLAQETTRRPVVRVSLEIAGPAASLRLSLNSGSPIMLGRAGYDAEWLTWMA